MDTTGRDRVSDLQLLARRLGARLETAQRVGPGDAAATWRITLSDGRSMAARLVAGEGAGERAEGMRRRMAWLAARGVPVPAASVEDGRGGAWLLTPWLPGVPGSTWLDGPHRARQLGRQMGELALHMRQLGAPFVHGDFAPINVLLDADGRIAALLDFEHAGPGPALLDVAWWGWVVRHHHRDAWEAAWPTFLAAAGLARGPIERELHALALRALEGRAAAAGDDPARARWLDHLAAAERWSVPG